MKLIYCEVGKMKKIALITTNKILAQSLDSAMKSMSNLDFQLFLLLNPNQALLDAEVLEIDVALIDMGLIDVVGNNEKIETILSLCERLHNNIPNANLLLLVSQDDLANRKIAIEAKKKNTVDDYVFYDASLKYLFAKVQALG